MKTINKEKAAAIAGIMTSLKQPFEYVIGASLVIAQDQCFHFDIKFVSFLTLDGEYGQRCRCIDCGKKLDKNELKRFMI